MTSGNTVLVIFSYGMSATRWKQMGILSKEKVIFEAYLESGLADRVLWFTYHPDDSRLVAEEQQAGRLHPGIQVIPAPDWAVNPLGKLVYSLIGPWLQRRAFGQATAMINHQTSGCWTGLMARLLLGGRFVYRYGHSLWRRHLDRKQYARLAFSWPLDRLALACSDHALVCTESDYRATSQAPHISHCPNFVEVGRSACDAPPPSERPERAAYVGRLMPFKNLFALIEACAAHGLPLDLYGDGPLRDELETYADSIGANCRFLGVRPNEEVRAALPGYRWFFLVSNYEAMPKALLEGMAAGCVCVAAPNYGCAEVIEDGVDGVLSTDWSAAAILEAMLRAESGDMDAMARRAMSKVQEQYSLERILMLHRQALLGSGR
ncbi:glycosyltransferase family 4 protein [Ferrimonas balearica]|uniref:glycosyltransferase family 4 protein n=1 Tax=Ferrimonas balearica TaxID=44012 RepID=UPI001C992B53|nr:glycosyltransferase family 4 protein [Ferrimonas balearica]MBY5923584.1 glycosyltransferase family 4 protein [Ferrimonas balearica]MBY5997347.1 glycosyltransferase family 4 protein [Ferrimonas balearica]